MASFQSSDRGTGWVLDLVVCGTVLIHQSRKICASASPAVRSGVAREKIAFNGVTQEQEGRVPIPVSMSGRSKVGIWDLDRAGLPGRRHTRGKQGQTKEKKFFCDDFKSSTRCWFLTAGFPVGLVLSQTLRLSPAFCAPSTKKMRFYTQLLAGILVTVSVVNAHVNIVYPALRGPDVSKDQILFCGQ